MNKVLLIICIIIPGLVSAQVDFRADDLVTISKYECEGYARKSLGKETQATSNYDVKWYRCSWNIDPGTDFISGNITTLFMTGNVDTDTLAFDMSDSLVVDSVIYHDQTLPWLHASGLLRLQFPSPLPHLSLDSVTVCYHGIPPQNGYGSFVQSTHNGVPIIWTLSEPYGASDWWPCKNGLTDKADSLDIFIKTPSAYKSASNGILVSSAPEGTSTVYHWKHRYPIATYLVCLGVTNYSQYTQLVPFGNDTLNVVNYVYPEDSASASTQTTVASSMIRLFDSIFGLYPFQREKYGHAQFGWGGGMEHQTMTFVTTFDFELLAHELAHQWFGDKVTCGNWGDIWLSEGFATYLAGLCYEFLSPAYWQRFREVRIKSIISNPGGSVFCTDTTSINRIFDARLSYAKGAMILHQLRQITGDSAFFAALKNYLDDISLAYGFANTGNFKSHIESSYGKDLTWYFDDWYTGEGYPTYQIDWIQHDDNTVVMTVNQTQSHPSVSFFEMIIPLKFKNQTRDTLIRISNTFSGQMFNVNMTFAVDSVIFDPNYELIAGNHNVNTVQSHGMQHRLLVYPVPAAGYVNFRIGGKRSKEPGQISIYNYNGRLVENISVSPGSDEIPVDTRSYVPGLYFYHFEQMEDHYSGKFMIIR